MTTMTHTAALDLCVKQAILRIFNHILSTPSKQYTWAIVDGRRYVIERDMATDELSTWTVLDTKSGLRYMSLQPLDRKPIMESLSAEQLCTLADKLDRKGVYYEVKITKEINGTGSQIEKLARTATKEEAETYSFEPGVCTLREGDVVMYKKSIRAVETSEFEVDVMGWDMLFEAVGRDNRRIEEVNWTYQHKYMCKEI